MKPSMGVPTEAVTIYNNALALSNKGDLQPALDEYKKAIQLYPSFIEAYNNIGEIYSQMGEKNKAISTYLEALSINRNYRVLLNLGVEYYNNGDFKGALKFFNESISLKNDFLEGFFYSGMANYNLNKHKEAEESFNNVVSLDSRHLKSNYMLSFIYYNEKKYNKTLECLDRIKEIADDRVFVNKYYGFCLYYLGKFSEASVYLTKALESCPQYSKFKKYLSGLTYENKIKEIKDIDRNIKEMEDQMMSSTPKLSECSHLSMLYIFQGRYKEAEKLLKEYKRTLQ